MMGTLCGSGRFPAQCKLCGYGVAVDVFQALCMQRTKIATGYKRQRGSLSVGPCAGIIQNEVV